MIRGNNCVFDGIGMNMEIYTKIDRKKAKRDTVRQSYWQTNREWEKDKVKVSCTCTTFL